MESIFVEEDVMLLVVLLQQLARLSGILLAETRNGERGLVFDVKLDLCR